MGFPYQFHLGPINVSAHFVFEVFAYLIGFQYFLYLRKNSVDTINFEQRMWVVLAAAAGALVGSRTVGYFSQPLEASTFMKVWMGWMSSKSILGGLLGGVVGVEIGKKCMGIKVYTGDLFVYPMIIAMMIGRLGCFSQGVFDNTHGIASNLPWAMDMGDGVLRHPVQLYEVIFLGALWLVLKNIEGKLVSGARFKIFMIAYVTYRLLIEWLKPVYFYGFGLSAIQISCILGLAYYFKDIINFKRLFKT